MYCEMEKAGKIYEMCLYYNAMYKIRRSTCDTESEKVRDVISGIVTSVLHPLMSHSTLVGVGSERSL